MIMRKGRVFAGGILLALGIFVCQQAIQLSLGQASRPGPGFVPFGLGSILILLSLLYLVPILQTAERGETSRVPSKFRRTLLAVGILCLFNGVLTGLGYLISTFLLFILWLMLIERKKWHLSLGLACLALVFVYVFNLLFSVQLPKGLLMAF
jgi:1,4-dihydroxy-2-naphthoate octaprenyltransferase